MHHGGQGRVPVRAIKTTTISILAVGLLAGSAVGVVAQDEEAAAMAPSWFTMESVGDGPPEFSEDPATGLPMLTVEVEATDARASGALTVIEDFAHDKNDERYRVGGTSLRLVNDGGAWVGTSRFINGATTGPDGDDIAAGFSEYTGEDGYEGLSMFTFFTAGPETAGPAETVGFIVPTDMVPAMPPPPVAQ
jgi:hypothetical protein